ncbi:hypothetical protein RBB77_14390 [Tunturibacter psychrotolerans]|uniref:Uncharacterized protein n=1 Tax=Tunturiibacter psychrotolerans TaxID=3069686 RepID=A0AAU7ZL25_9BACT
MSSNLIGPTKLDESLLIASKPMNSSPVNQAALALVAYAMDDPQSFRLDEIGLYAEAERVETASPHSRVLLESLRDRMRSFAGTPRLTPPDLARQMGRDCVGVQSDLGLRLNAFSKRPEEERVDHYALQELQFLMANCTVSGETLTQIAAYGVSTRSLSSRYSAVKILNHSIGTSLDPYQSKPLEDWIKTQKTAN